MTINEWNELKPGDVFALIDPSPDAVVSEVLYQVTALGELENWGDSGTDEICMSRQIDVELIAEPYEPWDVGWRGTFDPGECQYYRKSSFQLPQYQ